MKMKLQVLTNSIWVNLCLCFDLSLTTQVCKNTKHYEICTHQTAKSTSLWIMNGVLLTLLLKTCQTSSVSLSVIAALLFLIIQNVRAWGWHCLYLGNFVHVSPHHEQRLAVAPSNVWWAVNTKNTQYGETNGYRLNEPGQWFELLAMRLSLWTCEREAAGSTPAFRAVFVT